jgi:hypothetical protein
MNPMTIEFMLQAGHDCGLNTIDEAFSQIMSHYDCFFRLDNLQAETEVFNKLLIDGGFIYTCEDGKLALVEMTIVDCAKRIGYTLKELDLEAINKEPIYTPTLSQEIMSSFHTEPVAYPESMINHECKLPGIL